MKYVLLWFAVTVLLVGWALSLAMLDLSQAQRDQLNAVASGMQIVGVFLSVPAILFLLHDQHRIAQDLDRHPDLRVTLLEMSPLGGTVPRQPGERARLILVSGPDSSHSDPAQIRYEARVRFDLLNAGTRSARDLLVNVIVPGAVQVDEEHALDLFERKPRVFTISDGRRCVAVTGPYVHPKDHMSVTVGLRVPCDLYAFDIDVAISLADEPSISASFPVGVVISLTGGSSTA